MQFTFIISDTEDGKSVTMEMKRTDKDEEADQELSNAAALVGAMLEFLNKIDGQAVEETQKIQLQ